jgi:1-deoxy-D-xylulose-5-phosphate reductoisomerase
VGESEKERMQNITILGSTGSIGRNSLEVLERFPDRFSVFGLSTNVNIALLKRQIEKHKPKVVTVTDYSAFERLNKELSGSKVKTLFGMDGLRQLVSLSEVDLVINALVGGVGLIPTLTAIESGKKLALANKEALVIAGELVTKKAKEKHMEILPIDSEHSAIKQCLMSGTKEEVKRLILTASGGPFYKRKNLKKITVKKALSHPTWEMGNKITVDSATLMNKGLEVIEAHWLFDIPAEKIEVLVHPQSIVHSMVEFFDGSIIAQLSLPDMKLPIQYALFYPQRQLSNNKPLDLTQIKNLTFLKPDRKKFSCLNLCYHALKKGGTFTCVLNASNEVAVSYFLQKKLEFVDIPEVVKKVLNKHKGVDRPCLEDILKADLWARKESEKIIWTC